MSPKALWLSGGTGLLGSQLTPKLVADGWTLRQLSRRSAQAAPGIEHVRWDGLHVEAASLRGTRAVIHLAGEPVFGGLPTAARRRRIVASRVESTRSLVDALAGLPEPERPAVLVCASAIGYYGDRGDEELREDAAPGEGFLADLCRAWEEQAARVEGLGMRRISLRFGVVLSRAGGALAQMAPIFRAGLGGRLGTGDQWFSWIHIEDAIGLILRGLEDDRLSGAINASAPEPVRNRDYTHQLGAALGRPARLVVPAFAVRAALGPLAGELLGSTRVVPEVAESAGYPWRHPGLISALSQEVGR